MVEDSKKAQAKQTKKQPGPTRSWEKLVGCVNDKDSTGRTPLHYAIEGGHEDIVRYLVKQGASVELARQDRSTPLHIACAGNNVGVVKLIMSKGDKGAALKAVNEQGSTPLHLAAAGGHEEIVELLLLHGAPINSRRSYGNTPLHYAVINGHQGVVDLLLAKGAEVGCLNNRGSSVLHFSASRGHQSLVEKFLAMGMDANISQNDGNTALHFAATHGHEGVCNTLLDCGANPDAKNSLGNSALHCAASSGNMDIVSLLVEKGQADIALQQNNGCTPLHFAAKEGNGDTVHYLCGVGAPIDATDEQNQSALHYSCLGGHAEVTTYLIDEGASVEGRSENGSTPLHGAAQLGHPTIVRKLVERGADVKAVDEEGHTPLHCACVRGDPTVVQFLVDRGADYDAQDKDGDTPLHGAATMGHAEVVTVLIHSRADLSKANNLGLTPIHQAENAGHRNVALAITNSRDASGKTPLFRLVEELSMDPPAERVREIEDTVHDYIQCDADINIQVDGSTPLLLSIFHGYEDIAADLIKNGADVDNGHPLLAAALEICNAGTEAAALDHKSTGKMPPSRWAFLHRTSELLVAFGADVNAKIDGASPLEMAMQAGCQEFAEMLLQSNAQFSPVIFFDSLKELQTPIPDERREFIENMSQSFISSGSMDLSQPMEDGNTPLQLAIKGEQPEVALKLINAGCDISVNNPLFETLSVLNSRGPKSPTGPAFIDTALAIIDKRPSFDGDTDGVTCMDLAIQLGVPEVADSILGSGIDVNHHPYFTTCVAQLAQIGIPQNEIEAERYFFLENLCMKLMDMGCSVNTLDEHKNSPLELSIEANSLELVNHLLKPADASRMQRVNVDKKNALGQTVLIQCLKAMTEDDAVDDDRYSFLESTALKLVDYGADHANALQFAVQASHLQMVEILMSKDVELDMFTDEPVRRPFPGEEQLESFFVDGFEPVMKKLEEVEHIPVGEPWGIFQPKGDQGDGVVFAIETSPLEMWMMGSKKSAVPLLYQMLLELEDLKLNQKSGERVDFLVDIAGRFVDAGANVKLFHEGRALLDVAINTDELGLVEKIMDKLGDIDLLDIATGSTVLYRLLTQRKQRIESGDHAMKMLVARREDFVHDVASLLLGRGAELHISGPHGSLFDCAIGCGAWEVCGLILENSSMYGFCDAGGVPFLHKVLMALTSGYVVENGDDAKAVVETMAINLVDRGCDVNQLWDSKQPLDVAIVCGAERVINYLLRKGAIYSRTIVHTLLLELLEAKEDEKRRLFLESITLSFIDTSADVDVEVDGVAPLTLAIQAKNNRITQTIIEKSHRLGYPSQVGRDLLDSVISDLNSGHCDDDKMDYFKEVLPGMASRGWHVLQEVMNSCGDNNFQAAELVVFSLDRGADVGSVNPDCLDETPLHAAAANGLKTIAIKLLELGARPDARNEVGETPLIKACLHGKINMIELLLSHDADINATSTGAFCNMGPLHIAAATEMPAMVEVLLKKPNIDVNKPGHFGRSALHEAFYTSESHPEVSEELVYALLDKKADPNQQDVDGRTPMMLAAKHGMVTVVRQMMERGADVNITDNQGDTVYDYAVMGNQLSVYKMIDRKQPASDECQKRVIMHAIKSGMDELLDELLEVGGRVNVLDTRAGDAMPVVIEVTWDEPLWWAAYFGKAELVKRLAKSGVNVAVADSQQRTLFHWCSLWGLPQHTAVLEVLKEQRSPAENMSDAKGLTPLDVAIQCGNGPNALILGGEVHGKIAAPRKGETWELAKEIAAELGEGLYVDHEFGANLRSLCMHTETSADINPRFSNVEWKRPNELIDGSVARLDLAHLSQVDLGCCGNSWLLSSVLVSMETPYGLTTIFEQREIAREGVYSFKFRFGGVDANVIVDDRVPCLEGAPMYGGFGAGNNIAFMLLEKALAKLVGSYEGLAKGECSELFRVSPIGKALFEVCKPPEFVEDAELTELVHEVCKSACIMMLESTCAMCGDHSSPEELSNITEFFTQQVTPAEMGIKQGSRHAWAAEPKRVLPGTGSCSCQEPVVTLQVNVKSRVRVEVDDAITAQNIRVYATAARGDNWNFVWRHAVPGSATEFDLLLEPSMYPYIIFFTQMGTETSKPCYFDLWSDKEVIIGMVEENEDLMLEISKL
jgi:ankyrin repeat protein